MANKSRDFVIIVELDVLNDRAYIYPEMVAEEPVLGLTKEDVQQVCKSKDFANEILAISAHYLSGGMLPPTFKVVMTW